MSVFTAFADLPEGPSTSSVHGQALTIALDLEDRAAILELQIAVIKENRRQAAGTYI